MKKYKFFEKIKFYNGGIKKILASVIYLFLLGAPSALVFCIGGGVILYFSVVLSKRCSLIGPRRLGVGRRLDSARYFPLRLSRVFWP